MLIELNFNVDRALVEHKNKREASTVGVIQKLLTNP
jgi:hypothetical protein